MMKCEDSYLTSKSHIIRSSFQRYISRLTVSNTGSVTHHSERLKVSFRSEICWINEAPPYIRCVSWCRNGLGYVLAGQVPVKSFSKKRIVD